MSFGDETSSDEDGDRFYFTTLWRRRCGHVKGYISNAPAKAMKALALLLLGGNCAHTLERFDVALCVFLARCIRFNQSGFDPYLTPPGLLGCEMCGIGMLYPIVGLSVSTSVNFPSRVNEQLLKGCLPVGSDNAQWNDPDFSFDFLVTSILSCQPDVFTIVQNRVLGRLDSSVAPMA